MFVTEDYIVDRLIDYKVLAEHAQGAREVIGPVSGRRVSRLEQLWQDGYDVFAFPRWTSRLRLQGAIILAFSSMLSDKTGSAS